MSKVPIPSRGSVTIMKKIISLSLLITVVQFNPKALAYYLEPYSVHELKKLPPLRFPGPDSVGEVSGLKHEMSKVDEQIQAIQRLNGPLGSITVAVGWIPEVGDVLAFTSKTLIQHLLSVRSLEELKTDLKISLGIQDAFVKNKISHFNADVAVLNNRLEEMFGKKATNETKRHSAIPAIQVCERILQLFADESYLFWDLKLIFYPHLISFTALYSMAATATGNLLPYKVPALKKEMELLQATVLKYFRIVKAERLSKITITNRQISTRKPLIVKLEEMAIQCPKMKIVMSPPKDPSACVLGHFNQEGSDTRKFWSETEHTFYWASVQAERAPEWFNDTVTGQVFCGYEGCWNRLHEYYGNEIDTLTMSALKLLPYIEPPSKLPPQRKKMGASCHMDGYGRMDYVVVDLNGRENSVYDTFGCHKGYCWTNCFWGWCHTTHDNTNYVKCRSAEDCCPEWKCKGACSV